MDKNIKKIFIISLSLLFFSYPAFSKENNDSKNKKNESKLDKEQEKQFEKDLNKFLDSFDNLYKYIEEADKEVENKNYDKAIILYNKALEIYPEDGDIAFKLGKIYYEKKEYDLSIKYLEFSKAIEIKYKRTKIIDPNTLYSLGLAYFHNKDYEGALTNFLELLENKEIIEKDPNYDQVFFSIALCYEKKNDLKKAIEYEQKVLEINPNNQEVYINLGKNYIESDNIEKAFEIYNKGLLVNSKNAGIYSAIADFYYNSRQYELALKNLDNYNIYNDPKNKDKNTYFYLAFCYKQLENYDKAIELFDKHLKEVEPDDFTSFNNLGDIYKYKKEYDKALEYYNKAIKIIPDAYGTLADIGDIYSEINNSEKAIEYYNKSILASKYLSDGYLKLGEFYYKKKEYDKALEIYNRKLILTPSSDFSYYNKAIIYIETNKVSMALENLKLAIKENFLLKNMAKNDIRFQAIKNNNTFLELIK
ncbi:MAG: tetratricopeptide repeat protein [Candidatus Sericytochromatia bacterium]